VIKLKVVEKTVKEHPVNATHWSVRAMAKEMGIGHTSVQRIWAEYDLKPHLVKSFKVSTDPNFAGKVEDVVGLYLNPPERALVRSVDEKSQIQALDRTQLGLPLKKGRAGTMTHDYKRNGTTTLFAALDIATGKVIGECLARHRADEFLTLLKKIDGETAAHLDLHLILDNYATHKATGCEALAGKTQTLHPALHADVLLLDQPRRAALRRITRQRIRRGVFHDVAELKAAIDEWIEHRNQDPQPFMWTATAKTILVKHRRAKKVLAKAGRK